VTHLVRLGSGEECLALFPGPVELKSTALGLATAHGVLKLRSPGPHNAALRS
jgi:hypothetical protein